MENQPHPSDASDSDEPSPYDHVRPRPAPPGADAFLAARLGDCESLTKLITANPECVLHRDRWDATPLLYASLVGHTRAVDLLLAAGAVADEQSFEGVRAIYAALNAETKALLRAARAVAPPLCPLGSSLAPLAPLLPAGTPCWLAGGGADADAARAAALAPDIALRLGDGGDGSSGSGPGRVVGEVRAHRFLLWRAPLFRKRLGKDWQHAQTVWLRGGKGLTATVLAGLVATLATDRVEVPASDAAPASLAAAARAAGLTGIATAMDAELATQQHYARLKNGADGGAAAAARRAAAAATRFVVHPAALPRRARLAAHLGALADASAALAAQGVDGPASDVADVLLLPTDAQPTLFFRAHAALLAARSPYLAAALRFNGAAGVTAGEGDGLRPPPLPGRPLPRVRVGVPARPLAALLRFVHCGALPPDALAGEEDGANSVHPPTVDALMASADVMLVAGAKRAAGGAVDTAWSAAERGGLPPPLRAVCEILFSADARGAATLRRAALTRVAAAFDAAADAVVAAAQAGSDPSPDAAALAALVAAASAADADAAAAASARSRGVITGEGGPGGLGVQSLIEDTREVFLEAAGGDRDAAAACFDARLAAVADAAGVACPQVG